MTAPAQETRRTGIGFFDHMLDLFARHGRLDLTVDARGDLETGGHHTVEDVGICLGQALDRALGDRAGIYRYGQATVPMDEARAACAIDISGRGLLAFDASRLPAGAIGEFDYELAEEFFRAFAANARLTLHLTIEAGSNAHHMIEAAVQGVRAGAARGRGAGSDRAGDPVDEGGAVDGADRRHRLRDGQPPLGRQGAGTRRRRRCR